jgi:exodeoxyribonuclease VII small subunit
MSGGIERREVATMGRDELETAKVSERRPGSTAAAESPQPLSFEDGLSRLADLVGGLEGGRLGLAESIAAYEQGVSLVRRLHAELADVEQRVKTLTAAAEEAASADGDDDAPAEDAPPGSVPRTSTAVSRKGQAKRTTDRQPRGTGGRPRSLPGMDDSSAEV